MPDSSSNLEQKIKHAHVQSPGNLILKGRKYAETKTEIHTVGADGQYSKEQKTIVETGQTWHERGHCLQWVAREDFLLRSILIHQEMLSGKNSREKYSLCSDLKVGPWLI